MKEIIFYTNKNNKSPIKDWLKKLDKSIRIKITSRLVRLTEDNYGEHKKLDSNISELKFNFGSGYRIYYTEKDNIIIILLCAGDKKTQSKDIEKAKELYKDLMEN
ncbi:MAG: addiction module killer protein [Candidatus Melainabacteria bacterium]|nr:MAG: addiction module killer protein [Candidatus Melainabacteria bacterium]